MKTKIIITILLALSICKITAQDIEPAQKPVVYCGDSTYYIDSQLPQFTQNQIVKGWMWGSLPLINKALYCNQQDVWGRDTYNATAYDCNLFVRSNHDLTVQYTDFSLYCDHGGGENRLMARAMVFNPALEIPDPITDYYAIANQCNQNNHSSVFGFKYIHPQAYKTDSGLVLLKSRFSGFSQVLNEPWDIDKL